jgi:hypothetical protein
MQTDDYYEIGDFLISKLCYQSFPCEHDVVNKTNNSYQIMSAPNIYQLLKDHQLSHAHFNSYHIYDTLLKQKTCEHPCCCNNKPLYMFQHEE